MIFLWVFFFCLFVLSYASLFLLILLFLEICFLAIERSVDSDGRKNGGTLGGVEGGKAITRMYCMKNTFSQ